MTQFSFLTTEALGSQRNTEVIRGLILRHFCSWSYFTACLFGQIIT
jgi:hypothetical protein